MPLPRRFHLQNLMILVALAALTLGLATELQNRSVRDANATLEADDARLAAWHRSQLIACEEAIDQKLPYSVRERNQARRRSAAANGIRRDSVSFSSWLAERQYHRLSLENAAARAAEFARKRDVSQRRLLWPY